VVVVPNANGPYVVPFRLKENVPPVVAGAAGNVPEIVELERLVKAAVNFGLEPVKLAEKV
jgi:hypothetical protein